MLALFAPYRNPMENNSLVALSTSLWFEPWRDVYDADNIWKDFLEEEETDFLKMDMDSLMRLITYNGEIDVSKKTNNQVDNLDFIQSDYGDGHKKNQSKSETTTKVDITTISNVIFFSNCWAQVVLAGSLFYGRWAHVLLIQLSLG